jgi:CheY-like chemotaxis protein
MKALRVLVVEDDAIIAMLLADMCAGLGHAVCAIEATEADAVAAAVRCRPDRMIVDGRLRDGSGVSAVNHILRTGFVPHVSSAVILQLSERLGRTQWRFRSLLLSPTSFGPFNAHLAAAVAS